MPTSFEERCEDAAERFLQTVVIIDNEATYNHVAQLSEAVEVTSQPVHLPTNSISVGTVENSQVESSEIASPNAEGNMGGIQPETPYMENAQDNSHILDATTVIESFSEIGIICSIHKPKPEDSRVSDYTGSIKLARAADVLVIDWKLNGENLHLTPEIISEILIKDSVNGGRTRLIVVYTAEPNAFEMLADVANCVNEALGRAPIIDSNRLGLSLQQLRIVVLNKRRTLVADESLQLTDFSELPKVIVNEFSKIVNGLVPSAALHAIAAVRERTHQLLSLFNASLDGAFCMHRALIPEPTDSVSFMMGLISSELKTLALTDSHACSSLDESSIIDWFNFKFADVGPLSFNDDTYCLTKDIILQCIKGKYIYNAKGKKNKDYVKELATNWISKKPEDHVFKDKDDKVITREMALNLKIKEGTCPIKGFEAPSPIKFSELLFPQNKALFANKKLAHLQCTTRDTTIRTYFSGEETPILTFGTIIFGKGNYYLCLNPSCDSVRIDKVTRFQFVQLFEGKAGATDVIIKTKASTYVSLILKRKEEPFSLLRIAFKPKNSDRIKAHKYGEWRFTDTSRRSYQWLGELRNGKAIAFQHRISTSASRIGIDEFEWLRRQSNKT
ncbi:MAG: hypothetical protein KAS73_02230 [Candidatus Sabulitectum sp.]|nr:hypothetical protein [Candidatus Sabulitectum sp.]